MVERINNYHQYFYTNVDISRKVFPEPFQEKCKIKIGGKYIDSVSNNNSFSINFLVTNM